MRTLTCKHKIWGENWLYLRPYFKAFPVFNVLETCREYFLTIDLGSVEFIKKFIERFLEKSEFLGMDQITSKNCINSSWMQVNKILFSRDPPEQFPSFFLCSFQWNQNTMRWSCVPKAYHFLKISANCVASMLFRCFSRFLKLHFKILRKRSHWICSNFTIMEAIMAGIYSLKRFLQKILVQRNTKINEKRNGVITLPWRLRLQ